jgi:hypothetical protein
MALIIKNMETFITLNERRGRLIQNRPLGERRGGDGGKEEGTQKMMNIDKHEK